MSDTPAPVLDPTPPPASKPPALPAGPLAALFSGSRASLLLIASSSMWLLLTIFAASRVPAPGTVLLLLVGAGFIGVLGLWLAAAFYAWAFRRRLGIAAWLSLPMAALLAFALPWSAWFWSMRVSSNAQALTGVVEKYAYLPENQPRALAEPERVGPFVIRSVTRVRAGTALGLSPPGNRDQAGLLLTGAGSVDPSDFSPRVQQVDLRQLSGRWHRYSWQIATPD